MIRLLPPAALALALTLIGLGPTPQHATGLGATPGLHLRLDRSAPEADATVASPTELRLWFSQVPQAGATSARLLHQGAPVDALGDLEATDGDGSVFAAPVKGPLPPGAYTVSWRTMAADGHVVRGDFDFTVQTR